jgi:hypothetical protein
MAKDRFPALGGQSDVELLGQFPVPVDAQIFPLNPGKEWNNAVVLSE